jgi:hypothetical protein
VEEANSTNREYHSINHNLWWDFNPLNICIEHFKCFGNNPKVKRTSGSSQPYLSSEIVTNHEDKQCATKTLSTGKTSKSIITPRSYLRELSLDTSVTGVRVHAHIRRDMPVSPRSLKPQFSLVV